MANSHSSRNEMPLDPKEVLERGEATVERWEALLRNPVKNKKHLNVHVNLEVAHQATDSIKESSLNKNQRAQYNKRAKKLLADLRAIEAQRVQVLAEHIRPTRSNATSCKHRHRERSHDSSEEEHAAHKSRTRYKRRSSTPSYHRQEYGDAESPPRSPTPASENPSIDALVRGMARARLPGIEPTVFDGNALNYPRWKTQVQLMFKGQDLSGQEKLHLVQRYLSGPAKDAILGLTLIPSDSAYRKAMDILHNRFGNSTTIAQAFRSRLHTWDRIDRRDGNQGLRKFADFVVQCTLAQEELQELTTLDDPYLIDSLADKLPDWLTRRWKRKAAGEEENAPYPSFSTFSKFVDNEARIEEHSLKRSAPISLKRDDHRGPEDSDRRRPRQVGVMATGVEGDGTTNCLHCHQHGHSVGDCKTLGEKSRDTISTFAQANWMCFRCGEVGHTAKQCTTNKTCTICNKYHATCFHGRFTREHAQTEEVTAREVHSLRAKGELMSMAVPVWIQKGDGQGEVLTYALLDTQSDASFINEEVAKRAGLRGKSATLSMSTMANAKATINCHKYPNIQIRGWNEQRTVQVNHAYSRRFIPANRGHIPTRTKLAPWPHLRKAQRELSELLDVEVGILIGYNCPEALAPTDFIGSLHDSPYAVKTQLGWSAIGTMSTSKETAQHVSHRISVLETNRTEEVRYVSRQTCKERPYLPTKELILKAMEDGFQDNEELTPRSREDDTFMTTLEQNIRQTENGHYEMPLPLKTKPLQNGSREIAHQRWDSLKRKLEKDRELKTEYEAFMQSIIDHDEAEEVLQEELENEEAWYIPHFGVRHPTKRKLRVVFDCSARSNGVSLNDFLLQGPDQMNELSGILLRYRERAIGLACDVERMFHQFQVTPEHQNLLRFFWFDENGRETVYKMKVHLFGATSSPGCAAFGLRKAAHDHATEDEVREFVRRDFYVDDGLTSTHSATDATRLFGATKEALGKACLKLHKVTSNSREFLDSIGEEETAKGVTEVLLGAHQSGDHRALGVRWNLADDTLRFLAPPTPNIATRRGILSHVMGIFDPLGLISPCILRAKSLLQELCRRQLGWDEEVDDIFIRQWKAWREDFENVENLGIPRHCGSYVEDGGRAELHHFSDASESGYGACSYLRVVSTTGTVSCTLVYAKSKVTPLKVQTIPRLELQAAVQAAQVSAHLRRELRTKLATEVFWTDSKVVLGYLHNTTKRFHTFVANRVQQIHQLTEERQWKYVPSADNPADLASRGTTTAGLNNSIWFHGPRFLHVAQVEDPNHDDNSPVVLPEVKCILATTAEEKEHGITQFNVISSWTTMVKVLELVLRKQRWVKRMPDLEPPDLKQRACDELFRLSQEETLGDAIKQLESGGHTSLNAPISTLNPFLSQSGLIHVGGRLESANLPTVIKHPIILTQDCTIAHALVNDAHAAIGHGGRSATIQALRNRGVWMMRARKLVDSIIFKCVTCRKLNRRTQVQLMGNLPSERVEPAAPFTAVGCDMFGPFFIKDRRSELKRYGVLFTCLSSRAVHIEVAEELSTDSFINAFRRLQSVRGPVQQVRCDQGTNFVGAESELKRKMKSLSCDFTFNVPHDSHAGGVWERQIRSARRILSGLMTKHQERLSTEGLRTLLYEVTYVINSRPLTAPSPNDWSDPLISPNLLLTGKTEVIIPFAADNQRGVCAKKMWERVQALTNIFWRKWRQDYLSDQQSRRKWKRPARNFSIGDIVLVKDEQMGRCQWPMGRLTRVTHSDDGIVRAVEVRLATRGRDRHGKPIFSSHMLRRPVQELVLILEDDGGDGVNLD